MSVPETKICQNEALAISGRYSKYWPGKSKEMSRKPPKENKSGPGPGLGTGPGLRPEPGLGIACF